MENTKTLYNLEGNAYEEINGVLMPTIQMADFPTFYPVQELELEKKKVIYRQAENENGNYALIFGFQASEREETENGCSKMEVIPISNKKQREKISKLLEGKVSGPLNFW